jgi:hypothetical protein
MRFIYDGSKGPEAFSGIGSDYAMTVGLDAAAKRWRATRFALREVGQTDWKRYYPGVLQSTSRVEWCGIFALWILHQAGIGAGVQWEISKGFLYKLKLTNSPQPGDIAYVDQPSQHHAVVIDANKQPNQIECVNGNGGNAQYTGNVVTHTFLPRSHYSAFYSIGPWLPPHGVFTS